MKRDRRRTLGGQLLFGAVIIGLGVIFMLQNLGYASAADLLLWWPAALVAAGVMHLSQGRGGNWTWGGLLVAVGSVLLLRNFGIVDVDIWAWWPLVLVAAGASIVWHGIEHRRALANPDLPSGESEDVIHGSAVMGAWERRIASRAFRGGELNAMMGGVELDLRGATMAGREARIAVTTMMGGIEIRIPQGWAVDVRITPFMGGVEDKTFAPTQADPPTLILTGSVFMGGVEISN